MMFRKNDVTANLDQNTNFNVNLNGNPNLNPLSNIPHLNHLKSIDTHTLLPVSLSLLRALLRQYKYNMLCCNYGVNHFLIQQNSILHTITYSGVMYFRTTYSTTDFVERLDLYVYGSSCPENA